MQLPPLHSVSPERIQDLIFDLELRRSGAKIHYAVDPYEISSKHLDPHYARTLLSLTLALTKLRICHSTSCRAAIPPVPDPA